MRHTDQLGRVIEIKTIPKRIVSLVPSQTELLHDLGLEEHVVGITKFCVHPSHWRKSKTIIGGTKTLHIDKIRSLQPQLIIANKEENVKEQVEALAKDFPVWTSDVHDLSSAFNMMEKIGAITGTQKEAALLTAQIREAFEKNKPADNERKPLTAYFIWREPYMTIGGDTFIHQMLNYAGFDNVCAQKIRYPQIEISELAKMNCELLLLSSEPYPFKQKHVDELQALLPYTKILLADGEMFSWFGSRLLQAPCYFASLRRSH